MHEITVAILCFLAIQLVLVTLIVLAKKTLLPSGDITITINDDKVFTDKPGGKLLTTLADHGVILSSACGGGGTCGQCRCLVEEGGGSILPTEKGKINNREAREGMRLSCQVPVKRDLKIEVPPSSLDARKWKCRVGSNNNVATFIKELVLELPAGESVDFKAGGYIQIEVPPIHSPTQILTSAKVIWATGQSFKCSSINPMFTPRLHVPIPWPIILVNKASLN